MQLPVPLLEGRLLRRYKRFLADVVLVDGSEVTAHVADPGRLPGLAVAGARVWLSLSTDPKRKLAHRVELIEQANSLVGLNTTNANRLVAEAIAGGIVPALAGWRTAAREPRIDAATRLDFRLEDATGRSAFLEVKNVTWHRGAGLAAFPDARTERGRKHLRTLERLVRGGTRAILLFVCQREDVTRLTVARDVDPAYGEAFDAAYEAGVEVYVVRCKINYKAIQIWQGIPVVCTDAS